MGSKVGSKAMTIRIFDSKTDESVVIITDAKKSRIRELIAVKGSFWDIVKKMEDSLREEGCRYKCVFDSRTDKEDIAVAIGWSDGLDVHEGGLLQIQRYGTKQYAARKKYQEKCKEKELAQMIKQHEKMLEQMTQTRNENDPFYTIFMECKETPIENLYRLLSARAVSALRRSSTFNRPSTAYDLIMMNIQELSSIKNIGIGTLSEILTMLDNYLDDRYGMSSAQLRKRIGNYIYENTILNPEACGLCEHISYDGCNAECSLQEPCPYRD